MALSRLGDYIEIIDIRNSDEKFNADNVRGISTSKVFIKTKANLEGVSLKNYKIVNLNEFAYVADTSRRGDKIGLAFADTEPCIISSIYTVFKVKDEKKLLSRYLMMFFKRAEFDRYARFNSWGSARETFTWEDMCDIQIEIPTIEIQEKYVEVYDSLLENIKVFENELSDLKLVCDGFIEDLMKKYKMQQINSFLEIRADTNHDNKFGIEDVKGVSNEKKIIPTKANASNNDLSKFTIIRKNDFVYNPRNGVAVGLNLDDNEYIISWNNTAFYIKDEYKDILLPEYLFMFFCRTEWDRKVKYDSWGSSTEVYTFESLCETKIPVPSISIQSKIVDIYHSFNERKNFIETLKQKISNICPILIRGAVKEAKGGN